jgi:hypothetical protein
MSVGYADGGGGGSVLCTASRAAAARWRHRWSRRSNHAARRVPRRRAVTPQWHVLEVTPPAAPAGVELLIAGERFGSLAGGSEQLVGVRVDRKRAAQRI